MNLPWKARLSIRWFVFRQRVMRLVCRLIGHSRKVERKLWCDLCRRCRRIVRDRPRNVIYVDFDKKD